MEKYQRVVIALTLGLFAGQIIWYFPGACFIVLFIYWAAGFGVALVGRYLILQQPLGWQHFNSMWILWPSFVWSVFMDPKR